MLNGYAVTTQFLIDCFDSNPLVNTIIFGVADERDLNKANIFPMVHIMPGSWRLDSNRIEYTYDIAVLDLRHTPQTLQSNKIFGSNLIDNLNQSAAILAKELTKLEDVRNDYDIFLESSTSSEPIIFADKNLLDGFECSIVLSIQNEIDTCEDAVEIPVVSPPPVEVKSYMISSNSTGLPCNYTGSQPIDLPIYFTGNFDYPVEGDTIYLDENQTEIFSAFGYYAHEFSSTVGDILIGLDGVVWVFTGGCE